jgi:hypothetical protein
MHKQNLTRAHNELYRRCPDERFATLAELWQHCSDVRQFSTEQWVPPAELAIRPTHSEIHAIYQAKKFCLTDWSFSLLCSLARINRDTVNKLSPETASRVFLETLPRGTKPLQMFTMGNTIRSIHPASYTRLYDVELISVIREFAVDFQPPQQAVTLDDPDSDIIPATGLYSGQEDTFCFLVDPTGWIEVESEAFCPGFLVWNSEVGRRTVGIQTFWFQAVCANHLIWDAVEVTEFKRKHTANVAESLREISRIIEQLVAKRDQRRDAFAKVIAKAMQTRLGQTSDEVLKLLKEKGIQKKLATEALAIAKKQGAFTVFSVVDALTQLAGKKQNAGERTALDIKSSSLLTLAV